MVQLKLLPPLQPIVDQLLTQLGDEYAHVDDVVAVLQQDPTTTARLLSLANSALYNWPSPILTIKDAITKVLGLDIARAVGLGIAFSGSLDTSKCPNLDQQRFWSHSLLLAKLCSSAIQTATLHNSSASVAYTSALLSNLGTLALAHIAPTELNQCIDTESHEITAANIHTRFGLSQSSIAKLLAQHWKLPATLIQVIAADTEQAESNESELIECIRLTDLALHRLRESIEPLIDLADTTTAPYLVQAVAAKLETLDSSVLESESTAQAMLGA